MTEPPAREKQGGLGDVLGRAEPAQWMHLDQAGSSLLRDHRLVAFGEDRRRREAVDPNPERADLHREVLGEVTPSSYRARRS